MGIGTGIGRVREIGMGIGDRERRVKEIGMGIGDRDGDRESERDRDRDRDRIGTGIGYAVVGNGINPIGIRTIGIGRVRERDVSGSGCSLCRVYERRTGGEPLALPCVIGHCRAARDRQSPPRRRCLLGRRRRGGEEGERERGREMAVVGVSLAIKGLSGSATALCFRHSVTFHRGTIIRRRRLSIFPRKHTQYNTRELTTAPSATSETLGGGGENASAAAAAGAVAAADSDTDRYAIREAANSLDIRVGRIVRAWKHEEADSLYVEEVDIGGDGCEPYRIICSGLVKYIPLDLLQDKKVVVLANLKPRNMRGVKSFGMLMAASDSSHENVELLEPPESSLPGERIWFGDMDEKENLTDVATPNQIHKKKVWELVQPHLKTNDSCVAVLGEDFMRTSSGVVRCRSLKDANIS